MYVIHKVIYNHSVFIVALPVPTRVNIEEVKSTAIKITWQPLAGASGYTISYTKTGSSNNGQINQVRGNTANYDLTGLEENTSYDISVERYTGDAGDGKKINERAVIKVTTGKWCIAIIIS